MTFCKAFYQRLNINVNYYQIQYSNQILDNIVLICSKLNILSLNVLLKSRTKLNTFKTTSASNF